MNHRGFVIAATCVVGGCADGFFAPPATSGPASVSLRYSVVGLEAGPSFDRTNRVRVLVSGGTVAFDTTLAFTPQAETRLRINLPDVVADEQYQIELRLLRDEQMLLRGTTTQKLQPNETSAVELPLVRTPLATEALSIGTNHVCALDEIGTAWCWGSNVFGQLGRGDSTSSTTPVQVAGGRTYVQIMTSSTRTCALTAAGEVFCWGGGGGATGFAGLTPTLNRSSPEFVSFAVADTHTCALERGGLVRCWGLGFNGQMGNGDRTDQSAPTIAAGGMRFQSIYAAAAFTCGIDMDGVAFCWGRNFAFQSGTGSTAVDLLSPLPIQGGHRFSVIVPGFNHNCGIATTGAYCWGENWYGFHGLGTEGGKFATPQRVNTGVTFKQMGRTRSNGGNHIGCAVSTSGDAYCAGSNSDGGLGTTTTQLCTINVQLPTTPMDPPVPCSLSFVPVGGGLKFSTVDAGNSFACGITADKRAVCWGRNNGGQLGNGTTAQSNTPVQVSGSIRFP